jgi:hypothetical protein
MQKRVLQQHEQDFRQGDANSHRGASVRAVGDRINELADAC